MKTPEPLAAGLHAAISYPRLAVVLWLGVAVPAGLACTPLGGLSRLLDESPFREPLLRGWDSWGILSWLLLNETPWRVLLLAAAAALSAGLALQFFLTGGVLRTLMTKIPRPVLRRVVAESAALFRPSLWAGARYLLSLAFWGGLLVAAPAWSFGKLAEGRAPNGVWTSTRELWILVVGLVVYYVVSLRFDLARIALAREEAGSARGAYRIARKRLKGARGRVLAIAFFWTIVGVALQVLFTNLGVWMNPRTGAGVVWLVAVRQLGFVLAAMARVGFWASLVRFDEMRRDELIPQARIWQTERGFRGQPAFQPLAEARSLTRRSAR